VLELRREPSGSPLALAGALYSFGRFLVDVQDLDAASSAFAEAVAILRAEPASEELALGRAELALGECLAALGRAEDARGRLREAEALLEPYPVAAEERERGLRLLERLGGADE
jgi:tetratricopeptide (TPR) repeat protein